MKIFITYEDGTISWKSWDRDLFNAMPISSTALPHGVRCCHSTLADSCHQPHLNPEYVQVSSVTLISNGIFSTGTPHLDYATKTLPSTFSSTSMVHGSATIIRHHWWWTYIQPLHCTDMEVLRRARINDGFMRPSNIPNSWAINKGGTTRAMEVYSVQRGTVLELEQHDKLRGPSVDFSLSTKNRISPLFISRKPTCCI